MQWNDGLIFDKRYQFFEAFAGEGRVSSKWCHGMHLMIYVQTDFKFFTIQKGLTNEVSCILGMTWDTVWPQLTTRTARNTTTSWRLQDSCTFTGH